MGQSNRVILCGYHNMGCIALRVLKELALEVPAVFTHDDDPKENRWFDSLAEQAKEHGIPVHYADNINHAKWVHTLRNLSPDVLLSCYYRQMIGEETLSIPRVAALNLHGSLLPKYRGRCPVNWQILHGEPRGGITLHHMVKDPDAGDIVGQKEVEILDTDTPLTLFRKLEAAAGELLRNTLPRILDGSAPRIPQDHVRASYFGGRRPEDGKIDWSWPARRIYNLIRAVTWPYPGAFTFLGNQKVMIWWAEPMEGKDLGLAPGSVVRKGKEWVVQTGSGLLRIIKAGLPGEGPDDTADVRFMLEGGKKLG